MRIVWDNVGERVYESGLDRGVLYLPDGSAVPWNGLTSVTEQSNQEASNVYFDGMKTNALVSPGDFSGSMQAITYPDEFFEIEGAALVRDGVYVGDQPPKVFGLSYRTLIGTDLTADAGYNLHVLYNVTAVSKDKSHETLSGDPNVLLFEWDIYAVPEELPGFRPSAHVIIKSVDVDPRILSDIEERLYGSDDTTPSLMPIATLVDYLANWSLINIVDNGNGTWTATTYRDDLIVVNPDGSFLINEANETYLDPETYQISNTP